MNGYCIERDRGIKSQSKVINSGRTAKPSQISGVLTVCSALPTPITNTLPPNVTACEMGEGK